MEPLTSVFDLPDHLAAKAEPALVAADERHFAAIAAALDQAVGDLSARIDAARREHGVEGAVDRYVAMTRATQRLVALTGREAGDPRFSRPC